MLSSVTISALILGLGALSTSASPLVIREDGTVYSFEAVSSTGNVGNLTNTQLYVANNAAFIGSITDDPEAEPLYLSATSMGLTFTPENANASTPDERPYIVTNETTPLMFASSFGGDGEPEKTAGFNINGENGILTIDGQSLFEACRTDQMDTGLYEIYWDGALSIPGWLECLDPIILIGINVTATPPTISPSRAI